VRKRQTERDRYKDKERGRQNTKSGSVPSVCYIASRGVGEIDESHVP